MKNLLDGKWIALRWEHLTIDDKWRLFKELPLVNYFWDFGCAPHDNREFHGKLERVFGDSEPDTVSFIYAPDDALLSIDTSFYTADGFALECGEDRYRVFPQDDNGLILYLLEGVEREPQDYAYRIVLQRA